MTSHDTRRFYWESVTNGDLEGRRDELAQIRRGMNSEPGTAPTMWRFHTSASLGQLMAEHYSLVLFAIHQQGQAHLVHRRHHSIGRELKKLYTSNKFGEDAVERRFFAAVTAPEAHEVAYHLRGLIRQLRGIHLPTSFDYTELFWDLAYWSDPERRARAQRRWGLEYYASADIPDVVSANELEGAR